MSRSGYSDDYDMENWSHIRWRGAVASSIRGKRGQAFLRELVEALDAMPVKALIAHDLYKEGAVCAMGSVGLKRGVDMSKIDVEDYARVADVFGIASPLVQEIEYLNDEGGWHDDTPEVRWRRMRDWAAGCLAPSQPPEPTDGQ
jgi:hypothetical protein